MTELIQRSLLEIDSIVVIVTDTVHSPHSKRAYSRALRDFLAWYENAGRPKLNKATVQRYAAELSAAGLGAGSINQRLCAIRKLAREAADNGAIPEQAAAGIQKVKGVRQSGQRVGNWLTKDQAQALISSPNPRTLKGLRDRAILAVLVGCGLRRQEAAALTFDHVQQREGRWTIVDMVGKRGRVRTVPMPGWTKSAIDAWTGAAGLGAGAIFRAVNRGDRLTDGAGMTGQAIADVVQFYAGMLGLAVAAHDLRRTYSKLARKGGADLAQIQLSLGHASIVTTERYLGTEQDLTDAPCDRLGLRL